MEFGEDVEELSLWSALKAADALADRLDGLISQPQEQLAKPACRQLATQRVRARFVDIESAETKHPER
jgi:ABC-type branched-subunit amino acid transport system substrate-binding protein